uniref:Uncharacterized protein n=1 Tax=Meloidogyne javanica TaxID=6303 RepID=A0A915MCZ1_MELJA
MNIHLIFSSFILLILVPSKSLGCNCGDSGPLSSTDPFDALGPWHQRHLDCGIPPFAYRLPQDAQAKIHAIWVNYQAGDECEQEQEQTRAIIMAIPEETRMQLFKGVCGPGFLKNESDEVRDRFMHVWFNDDMTIEQKQTEFRKLAQELLKNEESIARFAKFDQKLSEQISERQQTIQKLSVNAREAYNKWVNFRKQEHNFLSSLPPEIRAELGLM